LTPSPKHRAPPYRCGKPLQIPSNIAPQSHILDIGAELLKLALESMPCNDT
jgi:hypothetical protein